MQQAYCTDSGSVGAHMGRTVMTVGQAARNASPSSLLGLLAKIKCSICSYQLNLWYEGHVFSSRLT